MMPHSVRQTAAGVLILLIASEPAMLAVDSKGATYMGGSAPAFSTAKDPVDGHLDTSSQDAMTFTAEAKPFGGTVLTIPYANIVDLEYGQKAGRRVGAA